MNSSWRSNGYGRAPDTLAVPMLLFLLTAREGRVSANHLGCPSSRNSRRSFVRLALASSGDPNELTHDALRCICVSRHSRPEPFLTKPAIVRVFYFGTNSSSTQSSVSLRRSDLDKPSSLTSLDHLQQNQIPDLRRAARLSTVSPDL